MHKKLFKIIDALDNKYDIEIQDYFKLTIEEREELAHIISTNLVSSSGNVPYIIHQYLASIHSLIRILREEEEYEKCDLFNRIEKKLFDSLHT